MNAVATPTVVREFDPATDSLFDDRILVERDAEEQVTGGGIHLPQKRNEELKTQFGVVLAVGPGRKLGDGGFIAVSVEVGDRVVFQSNAGYELALGSKLYTVMRQDEILLRRAR